MLSDRPYMRGPAGPGPRTWLGPLMITLVVCFVVEQVLSALFNQSWLGEGLTLTGPGIAAGHVWTLLTYGVLHGGLLHLGLNLLGLWLMGRAVEAEVGGRRLVEVFVLGVLGGGLFWSLIHFGKGAAVIGASGGLLAIISVWARQRWFDRAMLFPFPIEVPVRWLFLGLVGLNAFSLLVDEIPGRNGSSVAASAHLGGLAVGWLWSKWRGAPGATAGIAIEAPAWLQRRRQRREPAPSFRLDLRSPRDLRAEVDRILDKINAEGFGALSQEERELLDRAKDVLKS